MKNALARNEGESQRDRRRFLVVAAVIVGGRAIASANKYMTDPTMKLISKGLKECPHAEVAALKNVMNRDIKGPMLIVRENKAGQMVLAKPCRVCHQFITSRFPRLDVYYSSYDGEILLLDKKDVPKEKQWARR